MEIGQNQTNSEISSPEIAQEDLQYAALVDFKALNGLITDEEGNLKKMAMDVFASSIDVARSTLYEWMKRPGFWELVNQRRKEISPKSRLAKVHETWYLKAVKGDYNHMQLWLANFDPNFRMPAQKVEHEAGDSLVEAIGLARKRKNIVEGEVIDNVTPSA